MFHGEKFKAEKGVGYSLSISQERSCVFEAHLQPCSLEGTKLHVGWDWEDRRSHVWGHRDTVSHIGARRLCRTWSASTVECSGRESQKGAGNWPEAIQAAAERPEELVHVMDAGVNKHRHCPVEGGLLLVVIQLTPLTWKQILYLGNTCALYLKCLVGKICVLFIQATAPQQRAVHKAENRRHPVNWTRKHSESHSVILASLQDVLGSL